VAFPLLSLPALPPIAAGTTTVNVAPNKTLTLAPGAYGSVRVGNGAVLILTGGLYQLRSLDLDPKATVLFNAATEVRLGLGLNTAANARIIANPANPRLGASHLVVYAAGGGDADEAAGEATVRIGEGNVIQANILALRGTLRIQAKTQATGAFIGRHVDIGSDVTLMLDSAFRD
jgi:hypothetical protein